VAPGTQGAAACPGDLINIQEIHAGPQGLLRAARGAHCAAACRWRLIPMQRNQLNHPFSRRRWRHIGIAKPVCTWRVQSVCRSCPASRTGEGVVSCSFTTPFYYTSILLIFLVKLPRCSRCSRCSNPRFLLHLVQFSSMVLISLMLEGKCRIHLPFSFNEINTLALQHSVVTAAKGVVKNPFYYTYYTFFLLHLFPTALSY
jgi:hypothetical protein